ncbi:hypothetical protein SAMN05421664_0656 [Chryseobacterium soldanellicola]|uniref:Uncharacterized protein n=1 Tax=Chryseobacterium soldanellicola TaxID=311333 RepID=A0A1H0YDL6_9FLAO|nr:hypothetical protein [Chryseobacterium soldanellicola]SDQ13163.1 hypothetical protein SAMN05421664_0656 [Chryseobacterium soldanellicola]
MSFPATLVILKGSQQLKRLVLFLKLIEIASSSPLFAMTNDKKIYSGNSLPLEGCQKFFRIFDGGVKNVNFKSELPIVSFQLHIIYNSLIDGSFSSPDCSICLSSFSSFGGGEAAAETRK